MSEILCVTDRTVCPGDFLTQIRAIAAGRPAGIVLREKDLPPADYVCLAGSVLEICRAYGVPCILHSFPEAAEKLEHFAIHMPLHRLMQMTGEERRRFTVLGASCHSVEDALRAQDLGCTYITAGHVFETQCKAGLPGRGLEFLRAVCEAAEIPVMAIGGISPASFRQVKAAGAAGGCVRGPLMTAADPAALLRQFEEN